MTGLLDVAEKLYALPPGEFTATRNARAREAKAEGDRELSVQIGRLRRPALAAWVVNMLVRHAAEEMRQLLSLGRSLREAQASLDAGALRELTRQRRQVTVAMGNRGRALAEELGEKVSEAVARQVEDTLHAAMIDEEAASAVGSGMLTEPLTSTGLGSLDLTDAVADAQALDRSPDARPGTTDHRAGLAVVPATEPTEEERAEERRRARAEAEAAVAAARTGVEAARRKLDKATRRVEKLDARVLQLAAQAEELRRELAELEHRQERADDDLEAARDKQQRAERRHATVTGALDEAQARLDAL